MSGLNDIWQWLTDDASLAALNQLLTDESEWTKRRFQREIAALTVKGGGAYLVDFLEAWNFVELIGNKVRAQPAFWNVYKRRILPREKLHQISVFKPLVNLPAEIAGTSKGSSMLSSFREFAHRQTGHVFLVNPFLDHAGRQEMNALLSALTNRGVRVTMIVRMHAKKSDNRDLETLLKGISSKDLVDVVNFHYVDKENGRIRLSFHAKGIYAKDSCILATMNFIQGNMRKNVEFGMAIHGTQASQYYQALRMVAEHTKPIAPAALLGIIESLPEQR